MARVRKVTRTIVSTDVEVMTANPQTKEFASVVVPVAGTYEDPSDKALDKAVRKAFANLGLGDTVMVSITGLTPCTKHYTMLEDDFIKLAECKVLSVGETVDEDEDEE